MIDAIDYNALKTVSWIGTQEWKADRSLRSRGGVLVYFKAVFTSYAGSRCTLVLSANNRYKLWVNGSRVCEGPCKGDRYRQFFDEVDISELLVDGRNSIAVEVLYFSPGLYGNGDKTGPLSVVTNMLGPMLAVWGDVTTPDGDRANLSTGGFDWKYLIDESISWEVPNHIKTFMPIGAMESVDSSLVPVNWKTSADSDRWSAAVRYYNASGSGWGEFSPLPPRLRAIPFMQHRNREFQRIMKSSCSCLTVGENIVIPANTEFFAEYDAGELFTGYFNLHTGAGKGSAISITYAESYSSPITVQYRVKGKRDDCENFELYGYSDACRSSGGEETYEPFWWRTFRFVRIHVCIAGEPITLFPPSFVEVAYPLRVLSQVHSQSCDWIDPLWCTSIRTLKNCMHETYEDCPYYEQMQYALDTRLQILFTYALGSDTRLARKAIEDFHCTLTPEGLLYSRAPTDEPNIVPVFSLYWIMMLEDYYMETGDIEFVDFYRPTIDAVLAWFDRRTSTSGLLENLYYWEFIDWVEDWTDSDGAITATPDSARSGPTATTNLIYAAALDSAARLLTHSRVEVASEYAFRAQAIREKAETFFWDEEKGMYREGGAIGEYTQHAQAFAVLSGLATGEKAARMLKNAISCPDVKQCTYVFSFFLFRALEQAGLYSLTQGLWDKWRDALKLGLTTWPEDLTRQRSDCHAWGSLPVYEFARCFCGVRALEPGYAKLQIKPVCTYLNDMSGEIATPIGSVRVQWQIQEDRMNIIGTVPEGVPAVVTGPYGGEQVLERGGSFQVSFSVSCS